MEDRETIFRYELCFHPPALFEANGLMRKANKPALADAIWSCDNPELQEPLADDVPRAVTYDDITQVYKNYIERTYGHANIVFDGYEEGTSTKDATHQRRSKGHIEPTVTFVGNMICKSKKEHFLSNTTNKHQSN